MPSRQVCPYPLHIFLMIKVMKWPHHRKTLVMCLILTSNYWVHCTYLLPFIFIKMNLFIKIYPYKRSNTKLNPISCITGTYSKQSPKHLFNTFHVVWMNFKNTQNLNAQQHSNSENRIQGCQLRHRSLQSQNVLNENILITSWIERREKKKNKTLLSSLLHPTGANSFEFECRH